MIIRNDTISEANFASWLPSSISNLSDWWNASTGLSLTGTSVNSWTGINSNVFYPSLPDKKASYISSDPNLNGFSSIQTNPSSTDGDQGYWSFSPYSALGKTMIIIGYLVDPRAQNCVMSIDTTTGSPNPYIGGSGAHVSLFANPSGDYWGFYTNTGGGNSMFETINYPSANQTFIYSMIQADMISAEGRYFASKTNTLGNVLKVKPGIQTLVDQYNSLILSGYAGAYGGSPKVNISEVISLNGTIKDIDKINLDNYVSNKYFNL